MYFEIDQELRMATNTYDFSKCERSFCSFIIFNKKHKLLIVMELCRLHLVIALFYGLYSLLYLMRVFMSEFK